MDNKFDELLKELNSRSIMSSLCWDEDIPEDIWEKYFKDYTILAEGLDVEKHRWYELATTVIKIHGRILGIRGLNDVEEGQYWADAEVNSEYLEMEEAPSLTYKKI